MQAGQPPTKEGYALDAKNAPDNLVIEKPQQEERECQQHRRTSREEREKERGVGGPQRKDQRGGHAVSKEETVQLYLRTPTKSSRMEDEGSKRSEASTSLRCRGRTGKMGVTRARRGVSFTKGDSGVKR